MEEKLSQGHEHSVTKMLAHINTRAPVRGPERDKWQKQVENHHF